MSLSSMLTAALAWDLLVVAVIGARWLYRRSQERLARAGRNRGVVTMMRTPVEELPSVVHEPPTVVKGDVVVIGECPVPVWMETRHIN